MLSLCPTNRKLLEGEESRYFTLSDAQIPVPYVYRQSPIYTLPRVGGMTRKVEPQYKFVEEIITETTREDIEISDTGSDEAEEPKESDQLCSKKENEVVAAGSEAHIKAKKTQEPDAEEKTASSNTEQLDTKEKTTENKEKSIKKLPDVSTGLKEGDMNTEVAQNNLTATEETGEEDKDNNYNKDDDTISKTKETAFDTKTEKTQSHINADRDVEKVALNTEEEKQDIAKEIDQASIKDPQPTEQTATQEAITKPDKSTVEEISQKSENEKAKKETQHVAKPEGSSPGKTMEKDREASEEKCVEVDTTTADPQPVSQKAEAGQEAHPKSEADSKQGVETAQADVFNTVKAQDNATGVQKEPAEKVKTEAPLKSEVKEIKSEEGEKIDSKPEAGKETVKPQRGDSAQSSKVQKTQEDVSKTAANHTEVETSERKEIQAKDNMDSGKAEGSLESKKTEVDEKQMTEQQKVAGIEKKSEEQSQKNAGDIKTEQSLKTEETVTIKSPEIQEDIIQKDKELKPINKEIKNEQIIEKPIPKDHELDTSEDIKEMDIIKPKVQEIDSKTSNDVQPEQIVSKTATEKEQSKDQTKTDKDVHEIKDTPPEKSDETENSEAKQGSTKMDTTKMKALAKDPTALNDPKKPEAPEHVYTEKGQDNSMEADPQKESNVPAVTENGVNI